MDLKYEDISPKSLMDNQTKAMWEDIRMLNSFNNKFIQVPCPACEAVTFVSKYQKYGMNQVECAECKTQYISPRPPPEVLKHFYTTSKNYEYYAKHIFPATAESRRERIFKPRAELVSKLCNESNCKTELLVEVGLGYGFFCEEMKKLGLFKKIIGIEPTPHLAQICREKGIEVIEKLVEDAEFKEKADVVVNFEVIEHLFDPYSFLKACRELLNPGGLLILTCPNIAGFETQMLEKESETIDHEHLNYFNPHSLRLLAKRVGFTNVRVMTPGVLDVDIVYQRLIDRSKSELRLPSFVSNILMADDTTRGNFQKFLTENALSSNMMLICRQSLK